MAMNKKNVAPNMIDAYIGQRIRLRRNIMGITQKDLAARCDVTFQQIQKYETSGNRISVSRLFQIAQALETPITFFISGLAPQNNNGEEPIRKYRVAEPNAPKNDPMTSNETLKLINLYWRLPNDEQRKHILALLEMMGTN
jgi:transcriptional regulator with XRE-family HTH domain